MDVFRALLVVRSHRPAWPGWLLTLPRPRSRTLLVEDIVGLVEGGELFLPLGNPLFVADVDREAEGLQGVVVLVGRLELRLVGGEVLLELALLKLGLVLGQAVVH